MPSVARRLGRVDAGGDGEGGGPVEPLARLHRQGIPPPQIFSDWKWLFYWEFDDYARSGNITAASTYADLFGDNWLGRRRAAAPYRVVHDLRSPGGEQWTVIETTRYFSLYSFQWETYYAVRRDRVPSRDLFA